MTPPITGRKKKSDSLNLTVGLGPSLIVTDNADDLLCIRLQFGGVRLLTLRIQWCSADQ
jgi:hypothetical protein